MNNNPIEHASITNRQNFINSGYLVIETPRMESSILNSFDNMPRDAHSQKRLRQIRLSQYFCYCEENQWFLSLLPKRKYIQSAEYIHLAEAGGVFRYREQLECDPTPLVSSILDSLPIDRTAYYHANVNQIRVIVNTDFDGITVPEGPHRDGHKFSVIAVAKRQNVIGGETQIIDPKTGSVIFSQVLEENQAILIDDEKYVHYATNISAAEGSVGYRDIWVVEVNPWEQRAYGPIHDRIATAIPLAEVAA